MRPFTASLLPSVAPETAAPTRISSPFAVTSMSVGMRFRSTIRARPDEVRAQLNQEVGAASERFGFAVGVSEKPDGVLHRLGRLES